MGGNRIVVEHVFRKGSEDDVYFAGVLRGCEFPEPASVSILGSDRFETFLTLTGVETPSGGVSLAFNMDPGPADSVMSQIHQAAGLVAGGKR